MPMSIKKYSLILKTMYKLTLLLIPLILLSSCTIDWNDEKDAKIAELEKQNIELKSTIKTLSTPITQDCWKNKEKIEEQIMENSAVFQKRDYKHIEKLDEIFYSPIKNSCLYSVYTQELQDWKECNFHKIYDFSNSWEIWVYIEFNQVEINECDTF